MSSPSDNPLQSSNNFLVPVTFEKPTTTKLKQQQPLLPPHTTQKLTKKTKQCRICLQSEEEQSRLLNPCKCTGSIEYGHVHCLIEWIKRRIEMNADLKARCEVCDIEFNYRLASERILDCSKLKHHYHKQKRGLICFAVVYGTLFLFFIAMIVLTVLGRDNQTIFLHNMLASSGGATLIVSCMVVYLIVLVVLIILFISEYMIKQQIAIVDVQKYREPKGLIKNYKIYFRR